MNEYNLSEKDLLELYPIGSVHKSMRQWLTLDYVTNVEIEINYSDILVVYDYKPAERNFYFLHLKSNTKFIAETSSFLMQNNLHLKRIYR